MKKTISILFAFVALFLNGAETKTKPPQELKILMIGNSFSICNLKQMPQIAQSMGLKLDLASMYIGGCSLEKHWANIEKANDDSFNPYLIRWSYASLKNPTNVPFASVLVERYNKNNKKEFYANIPEMLSADKWDIITIQQASHHSCDKASYHPFGDNIVKTIKQFAPDAKIVLQETWSYPPWYKRLKKFGFDQVEMYARLHDAYAEFASMYNLEVIPVGTAAEFCPDRNTLFTKPDFHFNRVGEYLQGLVWTAKLFGVDVTKCSYRPDWLDEKRAGELKTAAMNSLKNTMVQRVFRDARVTRGNTNILRIQPIDTACWLWAPNSSGISQNIKDEIAISPNGDPLSEPVFVKFRNEFSVEKTDGTLVIDVSADERFYLSIDGKFIARGPNRSTVENWQYNTYIINLEPGKHVMEATVWKLREKGPLAQLSWRGGFALKANGAYDRKLSTGTSQNWKVGTLKGITATNPDGGAWGTGAQWTIKGCGIQDATPDKYVTPIKVRGFVGREGPHIYGLRYHGWMLFPSQLPDQLAKAVLPGKVVAIATNTKWRARHVFTKEEATKTIDFSKKVIIPANTKMQIAWDLGRYYCAYPEVVLSGGKEAKFSINWHESAHRATDNKKGSEPGSRNIIVGRYLPGYGDTFISDGRTNAKFSVPWFRCGKWIRIDIETKDEPLTVEQIELVETRYPVELESTFESDDKTLSPIREISMRTMQMCCHEMLFDCPFYEQQMYPGDTRVQLNVLSAVSRDDRIIKRAIELYDLSSRDDGQCPFNWPTRGTQEGATYTLCYLLMYGDYVMNHNDIEWLKARVPGMRRSISGFEIYENKEGLLENLPGWLFTDWVQGWNGDGTVPGGRHGDGVNAVHNLLWVLAMQSVAKTERALGNELQAKYWEEKIEKIKPIIINKFWCDKRQMISDTPDKLNFSEHAQCLALIGDVLPKDKAQLAWKNLIEDKTLKRCTVYFSYYLFETYFKFGRGDLFLKRLDLWRSYVKKGLTTTQEAPDGGKNGQNESRSDCHAWGAHPIWFMQTGLAGIASDAPFFKKVIIKPCPGDLKYIKATHPHPTGWIKVDLEFKNNKATGSIHTPVEGSFVFGGQTIELKVGLNEIQ